MKSPKLKRAKFNLWMHPDIHREIKKGSEKLGLPMTQLIIMATRRELRIRLNMQKILDSSTAADYSNR